jgi:hypothetical protein
MALNYLQECYENLADEKIYFKVSLITPSEEGKL